MTFDNWTDDEITRSQPVKLILTCNTRYFIAGIHIFHWPSMASTENQMDRPISLLISI